MVGRVKQERRLRVSEVAKAVVAAVNAIDETNDWDVHVGGKRAGLIRYDPRARVGLARAAKDTTIGDLVGCLVFVIRRC